MNKLSAIALTYNAPSNRVMQKCGFKFLDTLNLEGKAFQYYKLFKKDWQKNGGRIE